jgi:peptidoglycan/xylan/chitin deacetylase (PgdA/CDA1 family)
MTRLEGVAEAVDVGLGVVAGAGLLAGGYAYAAMWPASRIFGKALIAPREPSELALTFDDGPHPRWTPMLLEVLARYEVRATFFLMGRYAEGQRGLVRQMQEAGHVVGNHTWTHPNLAWTNLRVAREEMARTKGFLEDAIGAPVNYFRAPFGARRPGTLRVARQLGMVPVMWNAMAADWSATSSEQVSGRIADLVERNSRRGFASNVVLHDGGHLSLDVDRSVSVGAAELIVERFAISQLGKRRFVTVDAWGESV